MLNLAVIAPDKRVWSGDIASVSVPTESGYIQILNNHVPLVSVLRAGEVTAVTSDGTTEVFAVSQGIVEVRPGNQVVILANTAEAAGEIDETRAAAAVERARAAMAGKIASEEEYASVLAAIEKELSRVKVAIRHKKR